MSTVPPGTLPTSSTTATTGSTLAAPTPTAAPSTSAVDSASGQLPQGWAAFSADGLTISRLDGSRRHVVNGGLPGEQVHPDWSPDGSKLVFAERNPDEALWIMNADGTDPHQIVPSDSASGLEKPYWSPDGKTIAFSLYLGPEAQVELVNVDGSNLRVLASTKAPIFLDQAHWSPDGSSIAVEICRVPLGTNEADGCAIGIVTVATGQLRVLTEYDQFFSYPDWRHDGKALVFDTNGMSLYEDLPAGKASNLYSINIDGTGLAQLTHNPANGHRAVEADWLADGTIAYIEAERNRSIHRFLHFITATGTPLPDPTTPIFATHPRIHLDN
ncbi:MAG: hypothetical protein ABI862_12910 [Ilumatobacteraceae bacterium]